MDPIVLDKTLTNMVAFLLSWRLLTPVHVSKSMCLIQASCSNSYFQTAYIGGTPNMSQSTIDYPKNMWQNGFDNTSLFKSYGLVGDGGVVMGYSIDVLNCSAGFIKLSLT